MRTFHLARILILAAVLSLAAIGNVFAESPCGDLPSYAALRAALQSARAQANGGFNLDM